MASLARRAVLVALMAAVSITVLRPMELQAEPSEDPRRPNVILVMTDDQGFGDVGFHGNSMIDTPQLDQLARESVELTDFHVDPTCSETRAALMTGRYSCRVGVWHTIMGRSILRRDETTMAEVFSQSGYRTGIFGKWHLGDNYPYRPQDRGFDEVLVHGGGGVGQTPDYWGNDYFDDTYFHNGRPEPQQGYCTDVFFNHALEFIEQNRSRPFFCYLPTNAAHGPFNVDKKYASPYLSEGVPQPMANFYGMITNIDENVGRLRKRLDELELARNTILVFMTDNGTAAGVARRRNAGWNGFNAGLRGQKGSQFDGGHRVPFLVHWPAGNLTGGRKSKRLAAHFDLLPTLVDICQLQPPDVQFDGQSLKKELLGDDVDSAPRRTLVVHSQRLEHPQKWRKCAVMTERWRLVDGQSLYDLQADLGQQQDVAAEHPEVVRQLKQAYESWWSDVSQRFDEYVRIPLGDDEANPATLTCHDWHGSGVPWNQSHIRQMMKANGFWTVEIAREGDYELELRARPEGVPHQFQEGTATVEIDGGMHFTPVTRKQPIRPGSDRIRLKMSLPAGPARLKTIIDEKQRGTRGAYYVTVRRLPDNGTDDGEEAEQEAEQGAGVMELRPDDRVVLLGGTFIERMQSFDYFEAALFAAYPGRPLQVRNLGWSGDTVEGISRALFGSSEDGFQRLLKDVQLVKPTVILIAYGANEAHAGKAGEEEFQSKLERLLDALTEATQARLAFISPRPYEAINPLYPDPGEYNEKLERYCAILRNVAQQRELPYLDLHCDHVSGLTHNGVHLTQYGYWHLAPRLLRLMGISTDPWDVTIVVDPLEPEKPQYRATNAALSNLTFAPDRVSFQARDRFLPPCPAPPNPPPADSQPDPAREAGTLTVRGLPAGQYELRIDGEPVLTADARKWSAGVRLPWRGGTGQVEQLRHTVRRKNELFFHRYRPQNETYLLLFRKHEQGNNAVEIPQFDPLVEELDEQIVKLSRPQTYDYSLVRIP